MHADIFISGTQAKIKYIFFLWYSGYKFTFTIHKFHCLLKGFRIYSILNFYYNLEKEYQISGQYLGVSIDRIWPKTSCKINKFWNIALTLRFGINGGCIIHVHKSFLCSQKLRILHRQSPFLRTSTLKYTTNKFESNLVVLLLKCKHNRK